MSWSWREPIRLRCALRIYVITDDGLSRGRSPSDVASAALAGGATAIQLRSKAVSAREMCAVGEALAALCSAHHALLVINDRLDVALACGAGGVHLGQDDVPCARARAIAGPGLVIGVSAATEAEARTAVRDGADYLGAGAVFATKTKPDAGAPIGIAGLRRVVSAVELPVVAIGGVGRHNAAAAMTAGAAGVAVVSAVVSAADVAAATSQIAAVVGQWVDPRQQRGDGA